jgi:hypothetical protein
MKTEKGVPRSVFVTNLNKIKNIDLNQFEGVKKVGDTLRVCAE